MLSFIANSSYSVLYHLSKSHTSSTWFGGWHLLIFVHPEVISTVNAIGVASSQGPPLISPLTQNIKRKGGQCKSWTLDWTMDRMQYGQQPAEFVWNSVQE